MAMMAFVGGAALPGSIGSSDSVEDAPRDESLTYLLVSRLTIAAVKSDSRSSRIQLRQLSGEWGISILADFLECCCFGLGNDTDLVP
jgi:hypothetical protein